MSEFGAIKKRVRNSALNELEQERAGILQKQNKKEKAVKKLLFFL